MAFTPRAAARSAAAAIASASATVFASGFSHSTCLPASSAAIAISAWEEPGEQMSTTSMSGSSMTRLQSVSACSQPNFSRAASTRERSRPTIVRITGAAGRSKNRGATRQPCEWAAPMKP
jgi:hypothetical protein